MGNVSVRSCPSLQKACKEEEETLIPYGPAHRGESVGRTLMQYAVKSLGARKVDVNEQNDQAVGFYKHLGFDVIGRSPLDGQGRAFPLLHMELKHDG